MSRLTLLASAALAAAILSACAPATPRPRITTTAPASQPAAQFPLLGDEPTADGLFSPVGTSAPLTGEALLRARMSRAEILDSVKKFTAGDLASSPATSPATQPHDPPAQAVKYYLQGRALFLENSNSDAMDALDKALALDPDSFTVLRLMGRVCFAASQLARGSLYLQRAYRLAPEDMETNYLLGRYWLERKDNDRAVFFLLNADRVKTRGEAQAPLISFHLARALQAARYHAAAAAAFEQFLAEAQLPVAGYRYDRELSYLLEQQWAGELAAAENLVLIGDWSKARPHYNAAFEAQPTDAFIASRLVNADLHAKNSPTTHIDARNDALRFVAATKGSPDSLQLLLAYVRTSDREKNFIPYVTAALAKVDEPARTEALAAADDLAGHPDDAFQLLRAYAAKNPADAAALTRLFHRVKTPAQFSATLAAAGNTLQRDPARYENLFDDFAAVATTDAAAQWAAAPGTLPENPFAADLAAVTLVANDGNPEDIRRFFTAALTGAPDFFPARESFVHWLLANDQFPEAEILINTALAQPAPSPRAAGLQIDLTLARQEIPQALALTQAAAKKYPDDLPLQLRLAAIERARGQYADSDKLLTDLIEAHPQNADAYEALIGSLLDRVRRPDAPSGGQKALTEAVAWLGRLTNAVPSSIFGQVTTATLYSQIGRGEEAETMMAKLAQDHPDDPEVTTALARARQANGKTAEAIAGLQAALQSRPTPSIVTALAQLQRSQGKADDALDLVQRMVREHPRIPGYALAADAELNAQEKKSDLDLRLLHDAAAANPRSQPLHLQLARRLAAANRENDAVALLQNFIARNGETTDRLYELSHLLARVGQDADAEAALRRVLAILPAHTGANNDLGFYFADEGKNLDQAETLVKKALDAEPDNGAYLDSLAWVYYKEGRFNDALPLLEKALKTPDGQSAEVVAHDADALFRAGRAAEAAERWRQAQTLLNDQDSPLDKDDLHLKTYLDKILAALANNTPPEVTPTAQQTPPRAAAR